MADPTPKIMTQGEERALSVFNELWNDGEKGAALRAKVKEKYPDVVLPEDNLKPVLEPLMAQNKALQDRLDAMAAERDGLKARQRRRCRR